MSDSQCLRYLFSCLCLVYLVRDIQSCLCAIDEHPQTMVYESDFAIKGLVNDAVYVGDIVYWNVTVLKTYKDTLNRITDDTVLIYGGNHRMSCTVWLDEGEKYVLTGFVDTDGLVMEFCYSWRLPFYNLTNIQKLGLDYMYNDDCEVELDVSAPPDMSTDPSFCLPDSRYSVYCLKKQGICLKNTNGMCVWKINKNSRECEPERPSSNEI